MNSPKVAQVFSNWINTNFSYFLRRIDWNFPKLWLIPLQCNAPKSVSLKIQNLPSSWKYKSSCQKHLFSIQKFFISARTSIELKKIKNFGLFVNENYCTFCELNAAGHRWVKLITVAHVQRPILMWRITKKAFFSRLALCYGEKL